VCGAVGTRWSGRAAGGAYWYIASAGMAKETNPAPSNRSGSGSGSGSVAGRRVMRAGAAARWGAWRLSTIAPLAAARCARRWPLNLGGYFPDRADRRGIRDRRTTARPKGTRHGDRDAETASRYRRRASVGAGTIPQGLGFSTAVRGYLPQRLAMPPIPRRRCRRVMSAARSTLRRLCARRQTRLQTTTIRGRARRKAPVCVRRLGRARSTTTPNA